MLVHKELGRRLVKVPDYWKSKYPRDVLISVVRPPQSTFLPFQLQDLVINQPAGLILGRASLLYGF